MSETNTNEAGSTGGAPGAAPQAEREKGRLGVRRTGLVSSAAMDKTIVVRIERRELHPVYKKYVRRFTKLYAHDEKNEARAGDTVELVSARPMSKLKRWRLARVVRSGGGGDGGSP
jgi:small subunit ribosomal protein S17